MLRTYARALLDSFDRRPRLWLVAILVLAFALRAGVVLLFPQTIISLGYREKNDIFARIFLESGIFGEKPGEPSAYTRPGYAWFLIALYTTLGRGTYTIGLTQAAVSTVNVLLAYLIASRAVGRRAAPLAGLAMAIYPYPIWHDVHVVRTGLDAFFSLSATLCLLELARTGKLRFAAAAGAAMFAASQTTNLLLAFIPLAVVWLFAVGRSWRWSLTAAAVLCVSAALALTPWVVRNYALYGRFIPSTTDNGIAFYKNNNPYILGLVRQNLGPDNVMPFLKDTLRDDLPDAESQALYFQLGMDWIRQHPLEKLELMGYLAVNYWDFTAIRPRADTFFEGNDRIYVVKNLAYAVSFGPILLLGLYGLVARARHDRAAWLFIAIFAFNTLLYTATYATTRYRIPFDGLLATYAALVVTWMLSALARREEQPASGGAANTRRYLADVTS